MKEVKSLCLSVAGCESGGPPSVASGASAAKRQPSFRTPLGRKTTCVHTVLILFKIERNLPQDSTEASDTRMSSIRVAIICVGRVVVRVGRSVVFDGHVPRQPRLT